MTRSLFKRSASLTEGSIPGGILRFALPLFCGQLLQQLYNMVDAWVIGNFADNDSFAAVTSVGTIVFLVVGLFNGIAIGGSVMISRFYGAKDEENVVKAIHTNFLMALIAAVLSTVVGLLLAPHLLRWLGTPASVYPKSMDYLSIFFAGVSTIILYNICMSISRALGDSLHPLYYLMFSSVVNIVLDLLFVAHPAFQWGVKGAAIATVIAQGLSVVLCLWRMCRLKDYTRLDFRKLRFHGRMMGMVLSQGIPTGLQNAVITVGNLVIQKNINSFGAYAMAGQGAYSKIEGLVFLPIMSMAMALPTFVSQNLGAGKIERAKKGALFGILFGVVMAELTGVLIRFNTEPFLRFFVDEAESIRYGVIHGHTVSLFFFLLAFSHCAAGALRGCGKSVIPMIGMLLSWCIIRIIYVTIALRFFPVYQTISWAYPITWTITSLLFLVYLLRMDWAHALRS